LDIIHVLPDSVANQIAAGEVIQRPSSCLKELVENSLDAGADKIEIIVRDAGKTMLQIIDNGKGMSETDARMAFERHATSKIRSAADLFSLSTMGFRGEALASIAAVAHLEVQTRRPEDELGTLIEIAGSDVVRQEPCNCQIGTNFKVKDLFYNVPARRRFLKSNQTEIKNIITDFYRIALVYPHVQFTFINDDEILLELIRTSEKQRIEAIFGKGKKQFTQQLVDISTNTEMVRIHGFIGRPEDANKNPQQYFFVNGRFMRHPYFHKAVLAAYQGTLLPERLPSYFIYFEVPPELIDVNIHPTKTEIKFADEQAIWQILQATIREALGKFNLTPSIEFNREGDISIPILPHNFHPTEMPKVHTSNNYNPFLESSIPSAKGWEQLYEHQTIPSATKEVIQTTDTLFDSQKIGDLFQLADSYILMPAEDGLVWIHQHRAHVRVLYEQYVHQLQAHKSISQQSLFPDVIELTASEMQQVSQIAQELEDIGFQLEQLSPTAYSILGAPSTLGQRNPVEVLKVIIDSAQLSPLSTTESWQNIVALSLAKETAIPQGKHLTQEEIHDLVAKLFQSKQPRLTPDGKTVLFLQTHDEIIKNFK